jgi:predicted enzyme related to lactoylglutathione lyase
MQGEKELDLVPKEATQPRTEGVDGMIKGLRGATIWSEDLNNLLPFYRDVLGLPVALQVPGFVVLGELGAPALALGTHSGVHGRNADPARHMVGLGTDDLTADWKRLKAAGVEFVEDPTDYGNLRIATLKDPEGNLLQLLQPSRA